MKFLVHWHVVSSTLRNASSYTTLDITLVSSPSSSVINIFSPSLDVTLETATYICPWENTGVGRYTPTCLSDCPWLLLIVNKIKHQQVSNLINIKLEERVLGVKTWEAIKHNLFPKTEIKRIGHIRRWFFYFGFRLTTFTFSILVLSTKNLLIYADYNSTNKQKCWIKI